MVSLLLAHQGGWDEFLMVAAPIVAFALLLRSANRRAGNISANDSNPFEPDEESTKHKPSGLI